jgi:hypothetical protein
MGYQRPDQDLEEEEPTDLMDTPYDGLRGYKILATPPSIADLRYHEYEIRVPMPVEHVELPPRLTPADLVYFSWVDAMKLGANFLLGYALGSGVSLSIWMIWSP